MVMSTGSESVDPKKNLDRRKFSKSNEEPNHRHVVLCSRNALLRDCLGRALVDAGYEVQLVSSVAEWLKSPETPASEQLFLLSIGSRPTTHPSVQSDIETILSHEPKPSLVIEGRLDDPASVIETINAGIKGYFSPDTPLNIALLALEIVLAGGVYLPPSILTPQTGQKKSEPVPRTKTSDDLLTSRQKAVVAAVRQGKSNKIIAYELNMRESTVKVHLRNIMKRLDARNRTEVAFLTQKLFETDEALNQKIGDRSGFRS